MKPSHPPVAKPRFGTAFDPWNSSASGHQKAQRTTISSTTGWRTSRNHKLNDQLRHDGTVQKPPGDRQPRQVSSVAEMLAKPGLMQSLTPKEQVGVSPSQTPARGIFTGVVVYVNGSTYPLISDHKLKQVLCENGGEVALHLARRRVTHVIIGRRAGSQRGPGAGGGLAAGKLQSEIRKIGGCGLKYVGVEWVLESLRTGKRQPEARFADTKIAAKTQGSVYNLYANTSG